MYHILDSIWKSIHKSIYQTTFKSITFQTLSIFRLAPTCANEQSTYVLHVASLRVTVCVALCVTGREAVRVAVYVATYVLRVASLRAAECVALCVAVRVAVHIAARAAI